MKMPLFEHLCETLKDVHELECAKINI